MTQGVSRGPLVMGVEESQNLFEYETAKTILEEESSKAAIDEVVSETLLANASLKATVIAIYHAQFLAQGYIYIG